MREGRGRWAVIVAAVLGIVGGLTTAFVVPDGAGDDPPGSFADPLNLDIPLENLDCTGQSILVVSYGNTEAALSGEVADNPDADLHYLESDKSCPTIYGAEVGPTPGYAAYLGPYDDLREPCTERFQLEHRGDFVTRLRALNDIHVQCACVVPVTTFPELTTGMDIDANVIWVRTLQGLLHDRDPDVFPREDITGIYDQNTVDRVRTLQAERPSDVTGVVDEGFWGQLRRKVCRTYDF
ncbi:MAG: putative peptidoglycan binding protein [Nocardioides sp.]|nr:putative peptidoglycan binding protein [Nocardioides sp.]